MGNLIIIGMPGSGKSTFGRRLSLERKLGFVDTDTLIEQQFGCSLQTVVDRRGLKYMRSLEEQTICSVRVEDCVIATGGSVVYSAPAMRHLKSLGSVVYLQISLPTLLRRVSAKMERGLFKYPTTTLPELFHQRKDLYPQWADVILENNKPLTELQFSLLDQEIPR